jgi:hypothetical protein
MDIYYGNEAYEIRVQVRGLEESLESCMAQVESRCLTRCTNAPHHLVSSFENDVISKARAPIIRILYQILIDIEPTLNSQRALTAV